MPHGGADPEVQRWALRYLAARELVCTSVSRAEILSWGAGSEGHRGVHRLPSVEMLLTVTSVLKD